MCWTFLFRVSNGLELQKQVAVERPDMPIIFITGYGDVPKTVQAMKAGAVEFLTKPFSDDVLLSAAISIAQHIARSGIPWKCLDQLVGGPFRCRMGCYFEMEDVAPISTKNTYRT